MPPQLQREPLVQVREVSARSLSRDPAALAARQITCIRHTLDVARVWLVRGETIWGSGVSQAVLLVAMLWLGMPNRGDPDGVETLRRAANLLHFS